MEYSTHNKKPLSASGIADAPPPHNLEAEQAVLGSMVLDPKAIAPAVEGLRADDFYRDAHRVIFRAIVGLFERGVPVDLITLTNRLGEIGKVDDVGGPTYLASLPNIVPTPANVDFYIGVVLEKSHLRRAVAIGQRLVTMTDHDDAQVVIADAQRTLAEIESRLNGPGMASGIVLTRAADVRPERVRWAWDNRVPFGAVTLVVGEPGLGKSTITTDTTARWTRGRLPGDAMGTPLAVVIASAEDPRRAVLVPRLIAAGADRDLVHFMDFRTAEGLSRGILLPDDLPAIEAKLREVNARVLVIDPLVAHLPGTVNSWRDQDVRRALAPLAGMAERLGVAVICIVHLNKAAAASVLARVSGSVGIVAAARSMFLVARDPDDETQTACFLAHAKSNVSALAAALRFKVEAREVPDEDGPIPTSAIAWLGEVQGIRANDLLAGRTPEEHGALREAMEWLGDALVVGPRPQEEVLSEAQAHLISEKTLRRAKKRLRVASKRSGSSWTWILPQQTDQDGQKGSQSSNLGHLGRLGHVPGKPSSEESPLPTPLVEDGQGGQDHQGGQDGHGTDVGYLDGGKSNLSLTPLSNAEGDSGKTITSAGASPPVGHQPHQHTCPRCRRKRACTAAHIAKPWPAIVEMCPPCFAAFAGEPRGTFRANGAP